MHAYNSLLSAAQGLLGDVVSVLQSAGTGRFAVIGGWSPFLLNSREVRHPGSRDADILFQYGDEPGRLAPALRSLLDAGYLPSAKHEFQVLRKLKVLDTIFVFNVDLLHPGPNEPDPEMFAEHLVLPVPESEFRGDSYALKSIVVPQASFIFDGHVERFNLEYECLESGARRGIEIPLMDETGLIVTKAKSMSNVKRPRDSFDVFLAIAQARDYGALVASFRELRIRAPLVFNSLFAIRHALEKNIPQANAPQFFEGFQDWDQDRRANISHKVAAVISKFLADIPLPLAAEVEYSERVV